MQLVGDYLGFLLAVAFLVGGYVFGRLAEARHYRSIFEREDTLGEVIVVCTKHVPGHLADCRSELVRGSVVISVDYFKRFVAGLRMLFGGRLSTYESLLDRARREAVLRMQAQAWALGARMVFNTRFETSSISKGGQRSIGAVEVLVYGTALVPDGPDAARPGCT